jgi:hypothetical protein
MNKFTIVLLLAWLPFSAHAQKPTFSEGNEENYAFKVKVIDEFIERFNGDSPLLEDYIRKRKLSYKTDRYTLIRDLFDKNDRDKWNIEEVKQFIAQLTDASNPVYISFYDTSWFAELDCQMLYKGKLQKVILLLKVKVEEDTNCKWIISDVRAGFMPPGDHTNINSLKTIKHSLNPVSHATDFIRLYKALKDKENLQNYFAVEQNPTMLPFIQALERGELEYVQVSKVTYHFLQVKGWIFTVEQFIRPEKNSGWLISHLFKADDKVKQNYQLSIIK